MSKVPKSVTNADLAPSQNSSRSADQELTPKEEALRTDPTPTVDTAGASSTGICNHIKRDGSRCQAYAIHGSFYCFAHDPESAVERQAARVKGGQERSRKATVLPVNTPNAPLTTPAEVEALLADTINQVRRGEIEPRISNAVGYLVGVLMQAKEQGEIQRRLARVESIVGSKWANPQSVERSITESNSAIEFTESKKGDQNDSQKTAGTD